MKRREFISLIGGAAAWPLAARAQQKLPTIGFLGASGSSTESPWTAAFVQRLRELGWVEGRTVAIEYRWSEGSSERFAEICEQAIIESDGTVFWIDVARLRSSLNIAHFGRERGRTGKHMLDLSFTGFDPKRTFECHDRALRLDMPAD